MEDVSLEKQQLYTLSIVLLLHSGNELQLIFKVLKSSLQMPRNNKVQYQWINSRGRYVHRVSFSVFLKRPEVKLPRLIKL